MATPLSSDLPLSSELQSVFAQASTLAKQEGRPVVSAHLLLALYSVNNHAALFLEEHLLPTLPAQVQRRMRDATEHPSCVERICERSKRLARGSNCDDVTSMHLLAAMLRESNSSAYRMLEAGGINVSGIRTRVMSYATDSSPQHQLSPSRPDTDHPGLHSSNSSPIEIHPSLRQNLTTSNRAQQARSARLRERERNRSRLEERSSPVHPALHDTWLRTTPAGGIPTVDREDVQRAHPTPMAQAPQGHTQPAQASAATTPPVTHHTQQDRETPVVPRKTLKERFAELKKQARKRRSEQQNWPRPSTLSPDKIPPAVRRASKASRCRGQRPDEACDDEPLILPPTKRRARDAQEEERERAEERRREAVEDARQATQDLASRLFGKISKSDEDAQHEDDASCDTHPTEADEPVTQEVADEAPQHTQVPPAPMMSSRR